jgi:hypothetical protein
MNKTIITVVVIILIIIGIVMWSKQSQAPAGDEVSTSTDEASPADQAAVESTVMDFGSKLKDVSLLSSDASDQIGTVYAPYISENLLLDWQAHSELAPGRQTSSPWPDHVEITSTTETDPNIYAVSGQIVLMTSVEEASAEDDNAGVQPFTATVENIDGKWLITAFSTTSSTANDGAAL